MQKNLKHCAREPLPGTRLLAGTQPVFTNPGDSPRPKRILSSPMDELLGASNPNRAARAHNILSSVRNSTFDPGEEKL